MGDVENILPYPPQWFRSYALIMLRAIPTVVVAGVVLATVASTSWALSEGESVQPCWGLIAFSAVATYPYFRWFQTTRWLSRDTLVRLLGSPSAGRTLEVTVRQSLIQRWCDVGDVHVRDSESRKIASMRDVRVPQEVAGVVRAVAQHSGHSVTLTPLTSASS